MDIAILLQISAIINNNSTRYEASVSNASVPYFRVADGKLSATQCRALKVIARGKHRNHLHHSLWTIYEIDIEKIILRIARHNSELAARVRDNELTAQDVDMIVRRATFQRLKLQLTPSLYYIYSDGNQK